MKGITLWRARGRQARRGLRKTGQVFDGLAAVVTTYLGRDPLGGFVRFPQSPREPSQDPGMAERRLRAVSAPDGAGHVAVMEVQQPWSRQLAGGGSRIVIYSNVGDQAQQRRPQVGASAGRRCPEGDSTKTCALTSGMLVRRDRRGMSYPFRGQYF
jgi:hypothetical protein